jgi:hypothetical protein
MDLLSRRKLLEGLPNPSSNFDYVTGFEATIEKHALGTPSTVVVRYVPDRLILTAGSLDKYLHTLGQSKWDSLEDFAVVILDDIRNELVTRWVQVIVTMKPNAMDHLQRHEIMLQDYQPNWDNEELLSRLPSL